MNKIEKILKNKGITAKTKFHNYDYLYNSIKESIEEFGKICFDTGSFDTARLFRKYKTYEDFLKEVEDDS